jgi:hypothetical protein
LTPASPLPTSSFALSRPGYGLTGRSSAIDRKTTEEGLSVVAKDGSTTLALPLLSETGKTDTVKSLDNHFDDRFDETACQFETLIAPSANRDDAAPRNRIFPVQRTASEVDPSAIERLCDAWRATKTVKRETRFLGRPLAFGDEPEVRKFYVVTSGGEIVSLVTFDPICQDGRVIGYSPAIRRRSPAAPTGAEEAACKFAVERFREEGMSKVQLGVLPLYEVEKSEFRDSVLLRKTFQLLYRHCDRWIYSFRGHADFKHRYRGDLQKMYFATFTNWRNVQSLIGLMLVCRIFSVSRNTSVHAFPKSSSQERLVSTRSASDSWLHARHAGRF